ncbi:MAG: DUF962 domain-containing protein [Gammaproteobacteria bacterium]|nr:DUF962 domain-containing protein [Gammaproteobacteria bacterium]
MTALQGYLAEYAESHTHPINKGIHWVAVPVILFCVAGLFWIIPTPGAWQAYWGLNFGSIAMLAALLYYFRLSAKYGLGMAIVFALIIGGITLLEAAQLPMLSILIMAFIAAWIFQFIGHQIEGKQPSFFKDVQFLLIGPLWLLDKTFSRFEK